MFHSVPVFHNFLGIPNGMAKLKFESLYATICRISSGVTHCGLSHRHKPVTLPVSENCLLGLWMFCHADYIFGNLSTNLHLCAQNSCLPQFLQEGNVLFFQFFIIYYVAQKMQILMKECTANTSIIKKTVAS